MDQQTVFSQMQQFGNEWFKLVAEQTTRVTSALAELENLQKRSLAQAATFVDEAGRVAKESLATAEQFSAQWRRAMQDATQRTLEVLTPSPSPSSSKAKA
jgi:hypothetical protein